VFLHHVTAMCTLYSGTRDRPIDQNVVFARKSEDVLATTLGRKPFVFTADRTCRLILFRVVIIISFIRRGSDREIYVTRICGISSLLLLIIQFRQIVRIHLYFGCQNAGKLHFLYRQPSKYNIMSYYIILLCIHLCT